MYYVVQVMSSHEEEMINLLKKEVDGDVFTPIRVINKKFEGSWKVIKERYFPGYIFIETNDPENLFKKLFLIPGFTKLLGRSKDGETYLTLTQKECYMLDKLCGKENNHITELSDVTILEGKKIKVISGPLEGMEGLVTKVDLHKRCVYVNIDMLGSTREVRMGINLVVEK